MPGGDHAVFKSGPPPDPPRNIVASAPVWGYSKGMTETRTEPTSIDPTLRGYCKTHGGDVAMAYLGSERYGCWHCNPTRTVRVMRREARPVSSEPVGELPDWMCG